MKFLLEAATSESKPRLAEVIVMPSPIGTGKSEVLFVYGTLMRDGSRNWVLSGEEFLGEATLADAILWDTTCGFPAITLHDGKGPVQGEAWSIRSPATKARIDTIEGELYLRANQEIVIPSRPPLTRKVMALTYVWGYSGGLIPDNFIEITSGRWEDVTAKSLH